MSKLLFSNINAVAEILSHDANSLVIIMHANNEIGVVQPIPDISKIVKEWDISLKIRTEIDPKDSIAKLQIEKNIGWL